MTVLRNSSAEVAYPKGSIVVCLACGAPLYRLVATIWMGESTSRTGWKYAPVDVSDLLAIIARQDLDAGLRARVKFWTLQEMAQHCEAVPLLKNGELPSCPTCKGQWAHASTSADTEGAARFLDRTYVVSLATIPPFGKAPRMTMVGRRR